MAYSIGCVRLAREVGHEFSLAAAQRAQRYASAKLYDAMGLKFKGDQARHQADVEFQAKRRELIQRMEVNGCL